MTKRKYVGEQIRFNKKIKSSLCKIADILPKEYNEKILLDYFSKYYPNEWATLIQMQAQYDEKDRFLKTKGKKARYNPLPPEDYFFSLPMVKNILSSNRKLKHKNQYNEEETLAKREDFEIKRDSKIAKQELLIEKNTVLIQNMDPLYVDYYISAYHQKGTTIENKIEIVKDLGKYNSEKINTFFYKLNDAEHNNQIRQMTFKYLQDRGLYVKLRKNFKGKKKSYELERVSFNMSPEDLFRRLQNREIQAKKNYDVFISHSYADQAKIIKLYKYLNTKGFACYCDWTSDSDFLKRDKISKYTEEVLKIRIEQSSFIIYAKSNTAEQSKWVCFELEYAKISKKDIKIFDISKVDNNEYFIDFLRELQ